MKRIYFDISATTPIDKNVANHMHDLQKSNFGNPSSIHREGQASRAVIEKSRRQLSKTLNCMPDEIIFHGGGTLNKTLMKSIAEKTRDDIQTTDHIVPSKYMESSAFAYLAYAGKGVLFK